MDMVYAYDVNTNDFGFFQNPDDWKNQMTFEGTKNKTITGIDYRFMMTCFSVDRESGNKIWNELTKMI